MSKKAKHACQWEPRGVRKIGADNSVLLINPARTVVIMRCTGCGDIKSVMVTGHWTLEELRAL